MATVVCTTLDNNSPFTSLACLLLLIPQDPDPRKHGIPFKRDPPSGTAATRHGVGHLPPSRGVPIPLDVAAMLSQLGLARFGEALVGKLGMASVADVELLTEADLEVLGMKPLERRKLLRYGREETAAGQQQP